MLGFVALAEVALAEAESEVAANPNINTDTDERGGLVVPQTSKTLLPFSYQWLDGILKETEARYQERRALSQPEQLRLELDEFGRELKEQRWLYNVKNLETARRRIPELERLIADTERKIARWQEAEAYLAKRGLTFKH